MKRIALLAAVVAAAAACGEENQRLDQNTGGAGGGDALPAAPVFAGISGTELDRNDETTVRIYWTPATDDLTPAEELTYKLYKWELNPQDWTMTGGWKDGVEVREIDVTARASDCPTITNDDGSEVLRCSYSFGGLPTQNVFWFAIEVTDADGMSSGKEMVKPVVGGAGAAAPVLDAPQPEAAQVGGVVRITGNYLFDEPTTQTSLTLAGKPIPADFIEHWENREIRFALPAEFEAGAIEVTTPYGTVASPVELQIQQ